MSTTHTFSGKIVGPIGFGLMSLTTRPNPMPEADRFAAIKAAIDSGCTYLNGGTFYAIPAEPTYNSLAMLNRYFEQNPDDVAKVVLNVKGVNKVGTADPDGRKERVAESLEEAIGQLGPKGRIHQFEAARKDPNVDFVGETLPAIEDFVKAGKIDNISLSEINAETIRAAAKKFKIATVEVELSLFHTAPMVNGILDACAEHGITVVAYSPLGRGILAGEIKSPDELRDGDFRKYLPWFQPENFAKNLELVEKIKALAKRKGCTPGQIAINWLVALGKRPGMPAIIPVPSSTKPERVRENAKVVKMTAEDMAEIDGMLQAFKTSGERYSEHFMQFTDL